MRFVAFASVAVAALSVAACSSPDSRYNPNATGPASTGTGTGTTGTDANVVIQRGVIIDFGSGDPVANATVVANDAKAVTDAKGAYELKVHKGESFSMQVTAPNYVPLSEQATTLSADYDRGQTQLVPSSMVSLLHSTLNGYDPTLGVLSLQVLPTGSCKSEDGATVSVTDMAGAKVKYMIGKMPSNTATAVKGGEFPSAVIYNLPVNVPVKVSITSATCRMAAFPFVKDGVAFEATVTTQPGDTTSFQRLFLKGNDE